MHCSLIFCFLMLTKILVSESKQSGVTEPEFSDDNLINSNLGSTDTDGDQMAGSSHQSPALHEPGTTSSSSVPVPPKPGAGNYDGLLTSILPGSVVKFVGMSDLAIKKTLVLSYGVLMGRPECVKQAICILGNYFSPVPYKDILLSVIRAMYIDKLPQDSSLLFDIFRAAAMYGQDCQLYICDTQNQHPR